MQNANTLLVMMGCGGQNTTYCTRDFINDIPCCYVRRIVRLGDIFVVELLLNM